MNKSKRLLSVLLAVVLAVSCLMPVLALAASTVYYSVSFVDENGNPLGSEYQVAKGSTIDEENIPALPKSDVEGHEDYIYDGSRKHSSYSWDTNPATTTINGNTVFTRVKTTESCDYNLGSPSFKFKDDNKNGVVASYTCSKCGVTVDYGVNLNFRNISLSKGLPYEVVAGDGVLTSGYLDVSTIKTVVSALETVGVVPVGVAETINTVVDVVDKVGDVSDKIVEATSECTRNGHLYGAPTYSWNEDHSECYANFTCTRSSCQDYYDNHTVSKKMNVDGPYYTYATCTEDGIERYTATTKFTDTSLGSVDGFEEDHDFTTEYSHVWQPKLGHKYTDPVSNNDATCTEDGTTSAVCERCGDVQTNKHVGSALGCTAGAEIRVNIVQPTCTQDGSYTAKKYCIRCGREMSSEDKTIPANGHTWPDEDHDKGYVVEDKVLADCTTGGSFKRVWYCTVCGDKIKEETVTLDPTPHQGGEPVKENATEATCTEGGSYELVSYCTVCGIEMPGTRTTIDVPKGEHQFVDVTTPATCAADGKIEKVCSVCGFRYTAETIDHLEHNYESTVIDPTCTAGGYTKYVCTLCGDTYTADPTDAVDHSWDRGTVTATQSCESAGVITYTCTECGATRTDETPKLGHQYKPTVIQPGCLTAGYTKYTCSRCQHSYIDDETKKDPLGHSGATRQENVVPATCTAEGSYDSVTYCERCQEVLSTKHVVTPKAAHNTKKVTVLPTCTEQGYTKYKCQNPGCGYEYVATFKAVKDHRIVDDLAVAATCVKTGLTAGTHCADCGKVFVAQTTTPTVAHKWNSGVITTQPTTTEKGVKTYTCTVCKKTRTEAIPVISVKEATPTNEEANKAKVNKVIKKPANITTLSHLNNGKMDIFFSKVKGAQNYRVMYRKQGAKKWNYAWTKGKTQYTLTKLKKNGLYEFMFAAYEKNSKGTWERGDYSQTSYRYYSKENIKSVKADKKSATVTWAKDKNSAGYELFYSTDKDMKKRKKITVKGKNKTAYTIKGLKKGQKYYIRVRAIRKVAGKNYTGEFSSQKVVKPK